MICVARPLRFCFCYCAQSPIVNMLYACITFVQVALSTLPAPPKDEQNRVLLKIILLHVCHEVSRFRPRGMRLSPSPRRVEILIPSVRNREPEWKTSRSIIFVMSGQYVINFIFIYYLFISYANVNSYVSLLFYDIHWMLVGLPHRGVHPI
jgi:hypothetical protein